MQMQKQPCIRHLHIQLVCPSTPPHPPPPPPPFHPRQILQSLVIQFLLDLTAIPREIEDSAYAKFWEADEVYYHGRCANGE